MIFFFGTRPGKSEIKSLGGVDCPHCEQPNTLTLAKTSNWFHFFWIKLFKISNTTIAECSHCKGVFFKDEFSSAMNRALETLDE